MPWLFDENRPIYTQLLEQIQLNIISGIYPLGSKLPSVRDLAEEASVNPNTMQKALVELERSGLIHSQRTSGRYVTEDSRIIQMKKEEIASDKIVEFLNLMKHLGFHTDEILKLIHNYIETNTQ